MIDQADMARKVRALLEKAESTPFAEEAEALTAKAQELMITYSISQAMLTNADKGTRTKIEKRRFTVDAPYSEAKASLVFALLRSNACEGVYWGSAARRHIEAVGYSHDLDAVTILLNSLLIQQANEISVAIKGKPSHEHGKTWTNSFMHAYAAAIKTRLDTATRYATKMYEYEHGTSTAVALMDKKTVVHEAFETYWPRVGKGGGGRVGWSNAGASAGRDAAGRADIGRNVGSGGQNALGR